MDYIIGIDLGGTFIKAGAVSNEGELLYETSLPSNAEIDPQAVVRQIVHATEIIKNQFPKSKVLGVGIGSPGMVDLDGGTVKNPPNLANWGVFRLGDAIGKLIEEPIKVENDANAAAVGELKFGAGKGIRNFIMITLGTGVGGGIIVNGEVFRGEAGGAGEIGHTTIDYNGPLCGCGNHGCVEAYVGQKYLSRRVAEQLKSHPDSLINQLIGGDTERLEPKVISDAANKGDKFALDVWKETGMYIGIALSSAINILDIPTIIVGGGVAKAGKPLIDSIRDTVMSRAFPSVKPRVRVLSGKLQNSAGILGAAALFAK
jgi:glucokinase